MGFVQATQTLKHVLDFKLGLNPAKIWFRTQTSDRVRIVIYMAVSKCR